MLPFLVSKKREKLYQFNPIQQIYRALKDADSTYMVGLKQ